MRTFIVLASLLCLAAPCWAQRRDESAPSPQMVLRAMEEAFSTVADRVTPAVVNVSAVSRKSAAPNPEELDRFREFFGDELYERYLRRRREEPRATGSGLVVDPTGYILTNNHVIENASEIIVRLSDSRKFTARPGGGPSCPARQPAAVPARRP